MVECLLSMKSWVQSPALQNLGVVVHACKLSTGEVEAGGSEVQDHSPLHRDDEASLGYMRLFKEDQKEFFSFPIFMRVWYANICMNACVCVHTCGGL